VNRLVWEGGCFEREVEKLELGAGRLGLAEGVFDKLAQVEKLWQEKEQNQEAEMFDQPVDKGPCICLRET